MASSDGQYASSGQSRLYEAADLMLEHSRLPRIGADGGYGLPETQLPQLQPQHHPAPLVPLTPYTDYRLPYQGAPREQPHSFNTSIDGLLHSPREPKQQPGQRGIGPFPERAAPTAASSVTSHRHNDAGQVRSIYGDHKGSIEESEPISPASSKSRAAHSAGFGLARKTRGSIDGTTGDAGENEDEKPPPWSELKTKAGKDRKRLPLACIACRRKKIRCSGEKPACKHCLRSRIPCVYKVTARKAAPRTDYMAMLDKRLKRMEERVIKIIPKDEKDATDAIPRAILKPPSANAKGGAGKKRAAEEAFGQGFEDSTEVKVQTQPLPHLERKFSKDLDEGVEKLPSKAMQEHLSEVFFDCLYGQAYHLLHKPSYMRRLRTGTIPPVLVLAICAISARFSTHPEINSEPAFLRGEEWAAPAREIALKRYDEPTITILTVLLILGLHEFGTCHGGRSWMFGGMALRMAYALQLHQELDHDPLSQNNDNQAEFSPTDREIRRRTMWACFLMDRFNSSGTERPAFANEETIKIQLPIKETYFQMEMPGATESLDGSVPNRVADETGQMSDPKDNMGVCSYIIRIIALWGRVVKYLNLGGKQRDSHKCWHSQSGFSQLTYEAQNFSATLPADLQNNPDNLKSHAAEKLANQFIFLHISINQVLLFLHRWSIPTAPGADGVPNDAPKPFVTEAGHIAIEASNQISTLLGEAMDHYVIAPFAGYCAFMSGAVHVWGIFSQNPLLEASSKANLARNVKYLHKMKNHWGMFHFIAQNLKDIYRKHADASHGSEVKKGPKDASIFQYGDWFQKYPHGVSQTDFEDPVTKVKRESVNESTTGDGSDLQSVEEFFHTLSPPTRNISQRKAPRKAPKSAGQVTRPQPLQPFPIDPEQDMHQQHQHHVPPSIMPVPARISQNPISPTNFTPQQTLYTPSHPTFPTSFDMLPVSSMPHGGAFPQPLDRHILYGGYTGADPTSAPTLNELPPDPSNLDPAMQDPAMASNMWAGAGGMDFQHQIMGAPAVDGDFGTSAWFMPFNLNPPGIAAKGSFEDYPVEDPVHGMGGMPQQ